MSSPFRYFRKHTKAFMAVAAVMCMFLFVFASGTGSSRGGPDEGRGASATVATWDGGSINEGQLDQLVYQRIITNQFLRMLFVEGDGDNPYYDLPAGVPMLLMPSERPDAVALEAVSMEVLSSLAADAGITVSDATINHFLQEFGLKRVGTEQIRGIIAQLGREGNARNNEAVVINTLRKLLMAYFYRRSYDDAGFTVLPTERWDDWRSVNERISLQAAALPVDKFLDQVPEPTDEQLQKLYDEFKDAEPNGMVDVGLRELPIANPGFAEPRRVKLLYLTGSLAERTKKLLDTVTEEEIADYYERNKRTDFVKSAFGAEDFDNDDAKAGEGDATDEGATDGEAAAEATEEAPAHEPTAQPATEAMEEPAAEPAADATGAADSTAAPASEIRIADPAAEGAADAAPAAEEAAPAPGEGDQSRRAPRRSPFRMAALQAEPAADATAEADAPAEAPATEEPAAPASETPAVETSATDAAHSDGAAEGAASAIDPAAAAETADEEPVEFEPLEKVRDEIRETLARDKAVQQLQQVIGEAAARLQTEFNDYTRRAIEAQELKREAPEVPARLTNLDWLAEQYGLTAMSTEPLTARQMFETPVGKAADEQSGRLSVTEAVFRTLALYEPFVAKELEGDWYLVTKIEDKPKRIPEFAEVRDQVAAAWNRIEAAKLAETQAQQLAKEAEASSVPFDQFFADKGFEVVDQTELFSRRSYPAGPGLGYPPTLGDIPELKNVGPALIDAAFKLDEAQTAAVLNQDHSVAYVIRLHSRQYPPDQLKKYFLEEVNTWPGNMDMLRERRAAYDQALNDRLWKDVAGFQFDPEWEARRAARLAQAQ